MGNHRVPLESKVSWHDGIFQIASEHTKQQQAFED